eukprot:12901537-Prorocentrum_lima.AAC.1
METDDIFGAMSWDSIKNVMYLIFDGKNLTVMEVKDALEGSSTKAGKVAALRALPKISSIRGQTSSLKIGGTSY